MTDKVRTYLFSSKEIAIQAVEVVAEIRILLSLLEVFAPVFECLVNVVAADGEHVLGVGASGLLQAPSGRVVEVEAALSRTSIVLLEVISEVDMGEGIQLAPEAVSASVIVSDSLSLLEVLVCFLLDLFHLRIGCITTDKHVDDDILLAEPIIQALIDG